MRRKTAHAKLHHRSTLSYHAALRRTFGGMMTCVGFGLAALGGYLIREQLLDPVGSYPAGLLFAAVLISTGMILLSYLLHPGVRRPSKSTGCEILAIPYGEKPVSRAAPVEVIGATPDVGDERTTRTLALSNRYVDHARVRP